MTPCGKEAEGGPQRVALCEGSAVLCVFHTLCFSTAFRCPTLAEIRKLTSTYPEFA